MISEASPYLILIPKSQATILMSASSQYRCLCLLKDVKKLCKDVLAGVDDQSSGSSAKTSEFSAATRFQRLSWQHPIAKMTSDRFIRSLNLFNIEKLYNFKKSIEVAMMDRILCDEDKHLNLKDLPSFYACATESLSQMSYQLENGAHRDRLLDEALDFGKAEHNLALQTNEQLQEALTSLRANLSQQSSQTSRQLKSIEAIVGCVARFNALNTIDIIEAMLVLPFEHSRLKGLADLEYTASYMSELKFWLYHLRDIRASLDSTKSIRQQIDELQVQVQHLSELMPSPIIHQKLYGLL